MDEQSIRMHKMIDEEEGEDFFSNLGEFGIGGVQENNIVGVLFLLEEINGIPTRKRGGRFAKIRTFLNLLKIIF